MRKIDDSRNTTRVTALNSSADVGAERLLDDDTRVLRQTAAAQTLGHRGEQRRGTDEVERRLLCAPERGLQR